MRALPQNNYHLADACNWQGIRHQGLLCAEDLLRRAYATGDAESRRHRPHAVTTAHGARLRDRRPMPPTALSRALDHGLVPADLYYAVNGRVLFWLDEDRLERHPRAQRDREQLVLVFDAHRLATACGDRAALTPFNVGVAVRKPPLRGARTFVPYPRWLQDGWVAETPSGGQQRAASHKPAEFVITGSLPDAMDYLVEVRP